MIEFHLPGMTCTHCAGRVAQALKQADPACRFDIDLEARKVRVRSIADREALADALADAGYPPA